MVHFQLKNTRTRLDDDMKKSKLIHVSFDEVEQFIPRIPEQICPGEDNTIPRICAAPSVIKALPGHSAGPERLFILAADRSAGHYPCLLPRKPIGPYS